MKLTVVPVLSSDKKYQGLIAMPDLVRQFAPLLSADQPGAILEFTMNMHDYSLTEMARIVEENNAKILTALVNSTEETTEIQVSLKLSTTDLTSIVRSFERYDYKLSGTYLENKDLDEIYQNRYEEFMRYLNT